VDQRPFHCTSTNYSIIIDVPEGARAANLLLLKPLAPCLDSFTVK